MSKLILQIVSVSIVFFSIELSGADQTRESEIHDVVDRLTRAWRAGDGSAWADEFAGDADFTVWFGLRLKGAEEIAFGHQMIFDSFYADTTFEMTVQDIRFLGDNVAVALLAGSVVKNGETIAEEPDAVPVAVLERRENVWKIVVFQNTPFAVTEFRANGDIKKLKKIASQ